MRHPKKAERFHDNLSLITGKTIQIEEDKTYLDEKEVSKGLICLTSVNIFSILLILIQHIYSGRSAAR